MVLQMAGQQRQLVHARRQRRQRQHHAAQLSFPAQQRQSEAAIRAGPAPRPRSLSAPAAPADAAAAAPNCLPSRCSTSMVPCMRAWRTPSLSPLSNRVGGSLSPSQLTSPDSEGVGETEEGDWSGTGEGAGPPAEAVEAGSGGSGEAKKRCVPILEREGGGRGSDLPPRPLLLSPAGAGCFRLAVLRPQQRGDGRRVLSVLQLHATALHADDLHAAVAAADSERLAVRTPDHTGAGSNPHCPTPRREAAKGAEGGGSSCSMKSRSHARRCTCS